MGIDIDSMRSMAIHKTCNLIPRWMTTSSSGVPPVYIKCPGQWTLPLSFIKFDLIRWQMRVYCHFKIRISKLYLILYFLVVLCQPIAAGTGSRGCLLMDYSHQVTRGVWVCCYLLILWYCTKFDADSHWHQQSLRLATSARFLIYTMQFMTRGLDRNGVAM